MRTFFKVSMLGLLMVILTAITVTPILAQTPEELQEQKTAVYNKFLEHHKKESIEDKQIALDAAKEYNSKFKEDVDKTYNDYFEKQITYLEKLIKFEKDKVEEARLAAIKKAEADKRAARLKRFNDSYIAADKNINVQTWTEVFAAGKEIINNDETYALDTKILLAAAGSFYLAENKTPIDTFNNQIVNYAEEVINELPNAKANKEFGVFNFKYKTKDVTLAKMNSVIGVIKFYRQGKKDEGIAQYYKALQYDKDWYNYRIIGDWYVSKAAEIGDKRTVLENEKKEENRVQIKEYVAMEKGYADRAIDAFARSYSLAKADKDVSADVKTGLFTKLQTLFGFRYNDPKDAAMKTDTSINNYVATVNSKTMPNPATQVEPIGLPVETKTDETKTDETKSSEMKKDDATMKKETKSEMKKVDSTTKKDEAKTPAKNGTTRSRTVSKTKTTKDN